MLTFTYCWFVFLEQVSICTSSHDNGDRKHVAWVSRAVLCGRSSVFARMLDVCMVEEQTRQIVIPDASDEGVMAFVSFLVAGHPFGYANSFEAMEVWMLAHRYDVGGIMEWIMEDGINKDTIAPAMHFACSVASPKRVCPTLRKACKAVLSMVKPLDLGDTSLVCVSSLAMGDIVNALLENFKCPKDIFRMVVRWRSVNKDSGMEFSTSMDFMRRLDHDFLVSNEVRNSGLFPSSIQVFVKGIQGQTYVLRGIDPADRVDCLYFAAGEKMGFSKEETRGFLRLIFAGRQLEWGRPLIAYCIVEDNATLHAVGRFGYRAPCQEME